MEVLKANLEAEKCKRKNDLVAYQKKIKELEEHNERYVLINNLFCKTMPSALQQEIRDEYLSKKRKKNYRSIFKKYVENHEIEFPKEYVQERTNTISLIQCKVDDLPNISVDTESESESD